jgi:CheY-like chemotaxis protein
VLLIDDHDDARDMTAGMLHKHGFEVVTANTGVTGIELAKALKPDIALIDIGMPQMNGYEIARHLRSMKELDGIKLVALTGYGSEEDRQRSSEAGFDMHLIKPLSIASFTKTLEQICIQQKND